MQLWIKHKFVYTAGQLVSRKYADVQRNGLVSVSSVSVDNNVINEEENIIPERGIFSP